MKEAADKKKYKVPFWKTVKKHWMLLAMLAPAVIYVVIFAYIPMTGVVLAFKNYQYAGVVSMVLRGMDWITSKPCW